MYRILATATLMFIFSIANADCGAACNETLQIQPVDGLVSNNARNQYATAHELFVGEWKAPLTANLIVTWNTVNGDAYTFDERISPISPRGTVTRSNKVSWFVIFSDDGRTMHLRTDSEWGRVFTRVN